MPLLTSAYPVVMTSTFAWLRALPALACAMGLGAVGCSDKVEPSVLGDAWQSGSRLRARVLEGGGARALLGWLDSELGHRCEFGPDDGGVLRCMPVTHDFGSAFADAACTERVAVHDASVCPPELGGPLGVVKLFEADPRRTPALCYDHWSALPPSAVWRRGAELAGEVYSLAGDGACTASQPDGAVYALGDLVDPATFVGAEVRDVPFDPGLAARRLVAEDGAERTIAVLDAALGTLCTEWLTDSPSSYDDRCVAGHLLGLGAVNARFSDASCTEDAQVAPILDTPEGCPPRDTLLLYGGDSCEQSFEVRAVGPVVSGVGLYQSAGDACVVESPAEWYHAYGDLKPPDTMPLLAARFVGDGPLQTRAWLDTTGAVVMQLHTQLRDARAGTYCGVFEIDGSLRCVVSGGGYPEYLDAACTQPVVDLGDRGCPNDPAPPTVVVQTTDNCAVVGRAHALGPTLPMPAMLYEAPPHMNTPCTPVGVNLAATYHAVGEVVPAETFPEVREVVE